MLSRRGFLVRAVAAGCAPVVFANPVEAALKEQRERSISLYNVHTGESLNAAYWIEGSYQPAVLKAVNHLLRDRPAASGRHQAGVRCGFRLSLARHQCLAGRP